MTHTKTPWKTSNDADGFQYEIETADGAIYIAGCSFSDPAVEPYIPRDVEAKANAARIVACVNACDGIDNAALDAGAVAELVQAARGLLLWHQTGGQSGDYTLHEKALLSALAKLGQTP